MENTIHWCRDVTFNEDKSQVRTHNAPAVLAALRDLIRSALKLAGYVNTAAERRAHTDRPRRPHPLPHHMINRTIQALAGALRVDQSHQPRWPAQLGHSGDRD